MRFSSKVIFTSHNLDKSAWITFFTALNSSHGCRSKSVRFALHLKLYLLHKPTSSQIWRRTKSWNVLPSHTERISRICQFSVTPSQIKIILSPRNRSNSHFSRPTFSLNYPQISRFISQIYIKNTFIRRNEKISNFFRHNWFGILCFYLAPWKIFSFHFVYICEKDDSISKLLYVQKCHKRSKMRQEQWVEGNFQK